MKKKSLKRILLLSVSLVVFFNALSLSLYYGDDYMYPRLSNNQKGYYKIDIAYAYFNEGNSHKVYDSFQFKYNFKDDLMLSTQKKYISGKMTFGLLYKYLVDVDTGEIGIGIRNLGMNYSDTNSPFGQEFLTYGIKYLSFLMNIGVERIINNGSDFTSMLWSVETQFLDIYDLYVYSAYNVIGVGLKVPLTDYMDLNISAYGMGPNTPAGSYKALEFAFSIFDVSSSESAYQRNKYSDNKFTAEALSRLKNQEKLLMAVNAKVNAVEYIYSEQFQKKLIHEIVQQGIVDQKIRESDTLLIKTTMKHIQKGLEYYYLHDLENAYKEYTLANSLYPNMPLIHERLGSIYYKLGHYDKAKFEWLLTLSLDPENIEAKESILKLEVDHPEVFSIKKGNNDK